MASLTSLPKSGDLTNTNNYRGIRMIWINVKMCNSLILNRIRSVIDPKLIYNQNCFRPKRTAAAEVIALRIFAES